MGSTKPLFRDLNADDPDPEATEIESLCMNCHENGSTRLLLTRIPHYKEVVLMSFACEHCGFKNNEIQSGSAIAEKGLRLTLSVQSERDLNRQVVKSDYTSVKIVEIDFEIPARSQKGEITTIEGLINRSVVGLQQDQPDRRINHPEAAAQIDEFIKKLEKVKLVETPFTLILEDISGNIFIENPKAPQVDPQCTEQYFVRTLEQDHDLGIFTHSEVSGESGLLHAIKEDEFTLDDLQSEVLQFPTNCSNCSAPCKTNMKVTNIPHFKEVVIMATNCEACGHRTNEVKSGSGIEAKGLRIEVDIKSRDDFSRDVLKSDTCKVLIPELALEGGSHALCGRFTTVEGVIVAMKEQLIDPKSSHMFRDSQDEESKLRFKEFMDKFAAILDGKLPVTLVLDDPAGNSYVQSLADDGELDDNLRIVQYERTFEQQEELGLNDMVTENYEK